MTAIAASLASPPGTPSLRRSLTIAPAVPDLVGRGARLAMPDEACGLLIGRQSASGWQVQAALQAPNALVGRASSPRGRTSQTAFRIDPIWYLQQHARCGHRELTILGFWHSHPSGQLAPSPLDRNFGWPATLQCIVNGAGTALRWWWVSPKQAAWQPLNADGLGPQPGVRP